MDGLLEDTWGAGFIQYRTIILNSLHFISCSALFQLPIFFGQNLAHECNTEDNSIIINYVDVNSTNSCQYDCNMKTSYVNDFGLICDRKYLQQYVLTSLLCSTVIGALVTGSCIDIFGRRLTMIICGLASFASVLGLVFANSFGLFIISASSLGFFLTGLGNYTLPIELMPPKRRWICGVITTQIWSVGTGWMTLVTYLIRDWRLALQICCLPWLVTLFFPFWLPESPRWLLQKRRVKDAQRTMQYIADTNGTSISEKQMMEVFEPLLNEKENDEIKLNETQFRDMWKHPRVLTRFLILCTTNMTGLILWYTMLFKVGVIHCCIYLSYLIFFLMEGIVRLGLGALLMPRIRRKGIYFSIVGSALLFLIMLAIDEYDLDGTYDVVKLITGVISKFSITIYFAFQYITMSEINPTEIRQRVTAIQSSVGSIGSALTPLLVFNFPSSYFIVPIVAIGIVQLLFIIPPILNRKLPESYEEAEQLKDEHATCCTY